MKTLTKPYTLLTVTGKKTAVPIYIGHRNFSKIGQLAELPKYSSVLVITDTNVLHHHGKEMVRSVGKNAHLFVLPAGEKHKTLATVEKIWQMLCDTQFDRSSLVINIGGGVICDIGAFAAGTFMRGIEFIQVPTTLLAQADAAIGGKTGFNFNGLKNTIGSFAAPTAVICDTAFLKTLPEREYYSGFAEIIKHAFIADKKLFNQLLKYNFTTGKNIESILQQSTAIKCSIVSEDPFEKKDRKKLNFGHTVGHAIEAACHYKLLHGEAIAIGMIAEARMSLLAGSITPREFAAIEKIIACAHLPSRYLQVSEKTIRQKISFDKKNSHGQIKWAFLEGIGKVSVDKVLPEEIISEGINYVLK